MRPAAPPAPLDAAPASPESRAWHRPLRRLLQRLASRVRCGTLAVDLPDGRRVTGHGALPGAAAHLALHRWRALWKLALGGDIGLAEAYRDGDWSSEDLTALFAFGLQNEAALGGAFEAAGPLRWMHRLAHRANANTRRGSRQNIAFHYDLGNAFYALWLDPELVYSSALYGRGAQTLEAAQAAKLDRVAALLQLDGLAEPRVLEIGCGWGALALRLAHGYGARVTGLTLSKEQLAHARERVAACGLQERVDLRLQDYRDATGHAERYDRIVSIEMLEAVGERYWPAYFGTLRERLVPGGRAVVQAITIGEAHFERYRRTPDFIQRFIFPGGMLPTVGALREQAARAGLRLVEEERFGASYARTLAEWRRRFEAAWPAIEALGFDAPFRRLWRYYLCYCEAGFLEGRVDVGLYAFEPA